MNREILERWATLKLSVKKAEEEMDLIKEMVEKEVIELAGDKKGFILEGFGKFTVGVTRTWQFTDHVKSLEELLDNAKADEKKTGAASYLDKPKVTFTTPHDKKTKEREGYSDGDYI